jgi:hypothetical protein
MDEKPTREELKRRLREKINGKRSDNTNKPDIKKDPQTTLLNMGIDDPEILKMAPSLLKNPQSAFNNLKQMIKKDDEEAPPN